MPNFLENFGDRFGVDLDIRTPHGKGALKVLLLLAVATALLTVVLTPLRALAVIFLAATAILAFINPEAIVVVLAVYTPFEPFLLKFVPDAIYVYARYFSEGLIYLLVGVVAYRALAGRLKLHGTPLDLPFLAFLLVALTSLAVNAVPPVIGLLGLRQIIRYILLYFIVVQLAPSKTFVRNLTIAMFAVVVFEGLLGLAQGIVGAPLDQFLIPSEVRFYESVQLTSGTQQFWSPGARVFATMGRYDQLGTFLSFFLLIVIGLLYFVNDRRKRRMLLGVLALAIPAFIMTLSRASWFGLIFGAIAIGIVLMRDRRFTVAVGVFAIVLLVYVGFSSLVVKYLVDYPDQTAIERVLEVFSYERYRGEYFGLGRVFWIVQTPLVVVRSAPLFGVGPGQFGGGAAAALGNSAVYDRLGLPFGVYGTEGYIDNNWFSLWGETGTFGLIFYFWMFIALGHVALKTWRRSHDPLTRGLALAIPAFIMTLSRASWFGLIFGAIAIGIVLMRDRRFTVAVGVFAIVLLVYVGFSSLVVKYLVDYPDQTAIERVLEVFSYERYRGEYFGLGRVFWIVQTPLVVVRSAPLFGVGPGQFGGGAAAALGNSAVYDRLGLPFGVYGTEGYIDNNWFSLWGETGTFGLVFYFWMFVALGHVALKTWRRSHDPLTRGLALGYLGCLVAVTFQAFLATYLEVRTLALYLWLYGAFIYVLARREKIHS